jgi:hypothetical protein
MKIQLKIVSKSGRLGVSLGIILCMLLLSACTTQKIHFHKFTQDYLDNVFDRNSLFNSKDTFYLKDVVGGPYPESPNEFSDAVWHLVVQGYHHKYMTLPVKNVNHYIMDAYKSVLTSSGINLVETAAEADYVVEFFVNRIILKTQSSPGFNYTACLTHIKATSMSMISKQKQQYDLKGIAKVENARIKVELSNITLDKNIPIEAYVRYVFGSPTVFELSLAEGLKTLNN